MSLHILDVVSCFVFLFILFHYVATNLQWYSYSFERIITKHHKRIWHVNYFLIPILVFLVLKPYYDGLLFYCYLYLVAIPLYIIWFNKLDKKLIWTWRIKRLFTIFVILTLISKIIVYYAGLGESKQDIILLLSLFCTFIIANLFEVIVFRFYAKLAKHKLQSLSNLKIIAITGSYGKTSIKNFVSQILREKFNVYSTPRSVNTYKGLIADINANLNETYDIYVAEAGARNKGDIAEISTLLQQHYGIIGKIGNAHIEYFKDIQTTIQTKFELLYSERLINVFVHKDNEYSKKIPKCFEKNLEKIVPYPPEIKDIESNLERTSFSIKLDSVWVEFETSVLGRFNIDNIAVAILIAKTMGVSVQEMQKIVRKLMPVEHRLQKITTHNKIILDDSFNGNLEGMSEAIRISSLHNGRKIIVTPGLVEQDEKSNIELAKIINEVFDIAIITGKLNVNILDTYIQQPQKIILKNKLDLENILATTGQDNDLVLFANDAPSYV